MPKGAPNSLAITSRRLSVFTLDTSVIEAAGFNFTHGPLKLLANQLPPWMIFAMSPVVEQEVLKHRLANIDKAEQQIRSGYHELRRHGGGAFADAEPVRRDDFVSDAAPIFAQQLEHYLSLFNNVHIPLAPGLADTLFRLYFDSRPPFVDGTNKKNEFPDAAILVSLEAFARSRDMQLIAVSKDDGWGAFADNSDFVYRVKTLDELAALFEDRTPNALTIAQKLTAELSQSGSELTRSLKQFLQNQREKIQWTPKPWRTFAVRAEVSIVDVAILSAVPQSESVRVWLASGASDSCVAQISVVAQVQFTVNGDLFERASAGWREIASNTGMVNQQIELAVFLEFSGNLLGEDVADWKLSIDLGYDLVPIDMGKAPFELFKLPRRSAWGDGFDDLDSDIPF